jgi:hypothetical protein
MRDPEGAASVSSVKDCALYKAINCGTPIECPHGWDVCPICDPCTCEIGAGHRANPLLEGG